MRKDFLQQKYSGLERSPEVTSAVRRQEIRQGEKVKGDERIEAYLHRLEDIFKTPDKKPQEQKINILKEKLYNLFVIKPENVPEGYFELQKRIVKERGHGNIEISQELKGQVIDNIIIDQKQSLDVWIDYLGSEHAMYPAWLKYFTFRNIVKLGEYDKEKKEFKKRSKGTTGLFPDINREALSYVLDALQKKYGKEVQGEEEIKDQKWKKLLEGTNFGKLYAYAVENVTPATQEQKESIQGEWVKYDKNSNATPLYTSLQGHGTGWCTAGESVARAQLKVGDFYVYYSKNQDGKNTIPRVAIRMQGAQMAEVRGINYEQNLESKMIDITEEKMSTLPGAEAYKKKSSDMRRLTEIDNKIKAREELDQKDLEFLYEMKYPIQGFGHKKDPRIEEILEERDIKGDLSFVTGYSKEQIGITKQDVLEGKKDIKFYYGDLDLNSLTSAKGLNFPETIGGDLYLNSLTSAEGLKLPKTIGGGLNLNSLTSAEGLNLPETIGGGLYLASLTSAKGLNLPKTIGGDLYLNSLTSAEGLNLPETIGGYLNLNILTSAEKEKILLQYPKLNIIFI